MALREEKKDVSLTQQPKYRQFDVQKSRVRGQRREEVYNSLARRDPLIIMNETECFFIILLNEYRAYVDVWTNYFALRYYNI